MITRTGHRAVPSALGPPTGPAAPQAGRLRRPLLPTLTFAMMLLVAALLAGLPAYAYIGPVNIVQSGGDKVLRPDVSYDWVSGQYLVVWQDDYWGDGSDMDIWGRVFYADGAPAAERFQIAYTGAYEFGPKVAYCNSGVWLVAWVKRLAAGGDELHGTVVGSTGAVVSDTVYLTTAATEQISSLDVGSTTYGWCLIVFDRYDTVASDWDVVCTKVNGDGSVDTTAGIAEFADNDYGASVDQVGGDFLVAWHSSYPDGVYNIRARQVFGSDRSIAAGEFVVHDDTLYAAYPSVASDASAPEHFLVTYADQYSGADYDIGYAFVTGGAVEGSGNVPAAYTTGFEYWSTASYAGLLDTFFVGWIYAGDWLSQGDFYGAYLMRDGSSGGVEALSASGALSEAFPQSTCLWTAGGTVATVWDQWVIDPSAQDTYINERDWGRYGPNLVDDGPEYQYVDPTSVVPGTVWGAGCDIRNNGLTDSGPFYAFLYASADTTLDGADYFVGWVPMPDIAAGYFADCDWTGTFPGIPAGSYWLIWSIDPYLQVDEDNESDNTSVVATPITVGEAVNLHDRGPWYGFSSSPIAPGGSWTSECDVLNDGNLPSGAFTVDLYLSTDTTIDSSDYLIGEVPIAPLAAFGYADCIWTGTFPDTVPGGTYWVGWIIDPGNAVAEGNEDDNAFCWTWGQVVVEAPAMAAFSGTPTTGAPGLVVAFTDESAGAVDSWSWDFGDTGASALQSPSHTYAAVGTYDVSLTVTNVYGTDTEDKPGYITVVSPIAAAFTVANAADIVPLTVTFTDTTTGGPDGWAWDFGDPDSGALNTSTAPNPTHTYETPGYYDVTLTATKGVATDVATQEGVVAAGFVDAGPDTWAFHYILACATADMVQGYFGNKYKPGEEVNRGQMAVYLARALAGGDAAVPDPLAGTQTFSDVASDYWAYRYVEYAASRGVVQGYGGGTYKPDQVVNRGQMAVFIARSVATPVGDAGVPDASASDPAFPDVTASNDWAWCYKYVQYLATLDPLVVQGYPSGYYRPEVNVTRDQMAVYVQRGFELPMYAP